MAKGLPYESATPSWCIPKGSESACHRSTAMVTAIGFVRTKIHNQPRCPPMDVFYFIIFLIFEARFHYVDLASQKLTV